MMLMPNRRWTLIGLTSYGYGCARSDYAGVYTRVSHFGRWIHITTNGSYERSVGFSTFSKQYFLFNIATSMLLYIFSVKFYFQQ